MLTNIRISEGNAKFIWRVYDVQPDIEMKSLFLADYVSIYFIYSIYYKYRYKRIIEKS